MSKRDISSDFPYESRYIDVHGSKMHYIDEGFGDPILFLHYLSNTRRPICQDCPKLAKRALAFSNSSLNRELVKAGFAWWYRRYAPDDETLAQLEHEARAAKRGLWADPHAVAPWEWRGRRKRDR